jgi:hemerythrin-like domain-containing protein
MDILSRRQFVLGIGASSLGLIVSCGIKVEDNKEVTAVEDLMREHGVLRRALFIYSETAERLRKDPSSIPLGELEKTARLFQAFGEDYHEKKLEEAHIFPAVLKAGGEAAGYPGILIEQHRRGREITKYILTMTQGGKLGADSAKKLAYTLDSLVRMYRPHASREDTVVFPSWKGVLSAQQLDEMNDRFEDIEHQQFGKDGFENAVRQISDIEKKIGIFDLSQFTAALPDATQGNAIHGQ